MRLKYQLRGLGIGIILTAALLMVFSDDGEASAKADDMVVMSATSDELLEESTVENDLELEMEEISTEVILEENVPETTVEEDSEEEQEIEESSVTEETTLESTLENESVSEENNTQEIITEETSTIEETVEVGKAQVATIKIVSGDDSGTVARKLQTAGIVENASEFDAYLMQHGYDKKISVGTVEIEIDSSWLEIAEKISGK